MPCVSCSSQQIVTESFRRHAFEHRLGDVGDQIAERVDFHHFAVNAIGHLLHLRPGQFDELLDGPAQFVRIEAQAEPGRDRRHDIASVKRWRHVGQPEFLDFRR